MTVLSFPLLGLSIPRDRYNLRAFFFLMSVLFIFDYFGK